MLISTISRAKYIDFTPDLGNPRYWDSHTFLVCQVISLDEKRGVLALRCEPLQSVSKNQPGTTKNYALSDIWHSHQGIQGPEINVGDYLLIFERIDGQKEPIAVKKINLPQQDPLVASLNKIAAIRTSITTKSLLENATSNDNLVAEFCINELLTRADVQAQASADVKASLSRFRDNGANSAKVRRLANQLLLKLSGNADNQTMELSWLKQSILNSSTTNYNDLAPFIERLLELEVTNAGTVVFLTNIVQNQKANMAARVAAYGAFQNPKLFNYNDPDQQSEMIFAACLNMLSDSSSEIRSAGAALLYQITANINESKRRPFLRRATDGIKRSFQTETNSTTKFHLETYLRLLNSLGGSS